MENLKNEDLKQYVHYEKYNELREKKRIWKTIALLAIFASISGMVTIDFFKKDLKRYKEKESEYIYQIGLETIKKNQFNDSIARKKSDSTYWVYLKNKRTGRN